LIFFIIVCGLALTLLTFFATNEPVRNLAINILYIATGGFVFIFAIKAFSDGDFCRSEKHIETVKRIELMEDKGDAHPIPVDVSSTLVIPDSETSQIPESNEGGNS
jgi:hypothetical protein